MNINWRTYRELAAAYIAADRKLIEYHNDNVPVAAEIASLIDLVGRLVEER